MSGRAKWIVTNDKGVPITGTRKTAILPALEWKAARIVNGIGAFEMALSPSFDADLVRPDRDRMVQLWYAPPGGNFSLWRTFIILERDRESSIGGNLFTISGPDVNHLLTRRIVAAYAGETQSDKNAEGDDVMKEVVTEAIADGVAPTPDAGTRVWADLSIAGDLTDGPTVEKGFAFKELMTFSNGGVLPAIAKAARELGTEVFFDVALNTVSSTSIDFIFRTYTGQPGMDLTSGTNKVVFSIARQNVETATLHESYWKVKNYIYAAGEGDLDDREVVQVSLDGADGYERSQWGRCEGVYDARNQSDAQLEDGGYEKLSDGRPVIEPSVVPKDTKTTRFGKHWNWGDKVVVAMYRQEFNAIVWKVTLSGSGNGPISLKTDLEYRD